MSFFIKDLQREQSISSYLDKNFYEKRFSNYRRASKEEQLEGIDIYCHWDHLGEIAIDEKSNSSPRYINKFIPTFAFEIQNTSSGRLGWLLNDSLKTEYWLLIYVWANPTGSGPIWQQFNPPLDIVKLHCSLLKKEKLISFLSDNGYNKEQLLNECNLAVANNSEGVIKKKSNNPFYFYYTTRLSEKPFNIIMKRDVLFNLAEENFVVTS